MDEEQENTLLKRQDREAYEDGVALAFRTHYVSRPLCIYCHLPATYMAHVMSGGPFDSSLTRGLCQHHAELFILGANEAYDKRYPDNKGKAFTLK